MRFFRYLRCMYLHHVIGVSVHELGLQPWWVIRNGTSPTGDQPWQNTMGDGPKWK